MHTYSQTMMVISHLKTLEIYSLLFGGVLATFICILLVRTLCKHGASPRSIFLLYTTSIFEWITMCFFGAVHMAHVYMDPSGTISKDLLPIAVTALVVLFGTKAISDLLLLPSILQTPIGIHKQRKISEILVLRYGTLVAHTLSLSSWYVLIGIFTLQSIALVSTPLILIYAGLIIFGIASGTMLEHYLHTEFYKKTSHPKVPHWVRIWSK